MYSTFGFYDTFPLPVVGIYPDGIELWKNEKCRIEFERHNFSSEEEQKILAFIVDNIGISPPLIPKWSKTTVKTYTGSKQIHFKLNVGRIETGEIIILIRDVTLQVNSNRFLKTGTAGIFQFSNRGVLLYRNQGFSELLHLNASNLLLSGFLADDARGQLEREGELINSIVKYRRPDNSFLYAIANVFKFVPIDSGEPNTYWGVICDISYLMEIMEEAPLGLYRIEKKGERHLIRYANKKFAQLLEVSDKESMIGKEIREYVDPTEIEKFLDKFEQLPPGGILKNYQLTINLKNGGKRILEKHVMRIVDKYGEWRVGTEKDVTEFVRQKDLLMLLQFRTGKILHTYSATLTMVNQVVSAILPTIGKDLLNEDGVLSEEFLFETLRSELKGLHTTMENLMEETLLNSISTSDFEFLRETWENRSWDSITIPLLRKRVFRLKSKVEHLRKELIKKAPVRAVLRLSDSALRLCNLYSLKISQEDIHEMEHGVSALRGFLLSQTPEAEVSEKVDLVEIIRKVIVRLQEFALHRRVTIVLTPRKPEIYLTTVRRDVHRCIFNLLHNAIKYSWTKPKEDSFVSISVDASDKLAIISIGNYGVAIDERELKDDLIFQLGFRGGNSSDRDRPGTGVGLADVYDTIRKLGGDIRLSSKPTSGHKLGDFSQPYLTMATLTVKIKDQ